MQSLGSRTRPINTLLVQRAYTSSDENSRTKLQNVVADSTAGIAQAVGVIDGMSGTPMWQRLLVPLMGIPFNCGGLTVRVVFEALVEPLEPIVGHRSATVASNFGFYAVLLAVQMVIVTTINVIRGRRSQIWFDPVIITVSLLLLLNSLVNVTWPWWGS